MSNHQTLTDLHSATSSQVSEDGQEPCSSQDGVQTDLFGREALLANPSPQQEREKEKTTSDTSGLSSLISSESANLQQCLANRLQQLSDTDGSMIYKLTLKKKDTPQQRSYYQLGASARSTKGTGSSSQPSAWLTPTTSDTNGIRKLDGKRSGGLNTQVVSAWPTPMSSDNRDRGKFRDASVQRRIAKGKSIELSMLVESVHPWPTPTHHNSKEGGYPGELTRKTVPLGAMKHLVSGEIPRSSTAETESTAPSQLNPRFSLWLMGYPIEWAYSAEQVTPLSRKQRQKS